MGFCPCRGRFASAFASERGDGCAILFEVRIAKGKGSMLLTQRMTFFVSWFQTLGLATAGSANPVGSEVHQRTENDYEKSVGPA